MNSDPQRLPGQSFKRNLLLWFTGVVFILGAGVLAIRSVLPPAHLQHDIDKVKQYLETPLEKNYWGVKSLKTGSIVGYDAAYWLVFDNLVTCVNIQAKRMTPSLPFSQSVSGITFTEDPKK